MEDGVKEEPAQCKEPKFLGKAGWLKKAQGRVLASYKDRYIHLEKTEIVVYENEDLQNCLERLDLENYDKCHELKSPFQRKHRLILVRSAKSGNKAHDVKFQAQTAEEKEAWIKAVTNGINRAKNKIFDEVKVDESTNLEHVTRTRPKGNRNRRPPTRIHMKEVADVSSDGILRLDLDLEDAVMPNGTHYANVDGTKTPKEAINVPTSLSSISEAAEKRSGTSSEEGAQTEPEVSPQKKIIKPPMPPSKEAKSSSVPEVKSDKDDGPEKKVLRPPMPPSKEDKSCISPVEEVTEEATAEMSVKSPDIRKTGPPPAPPNKPTTSSSKSNTSEASKVMPNPNPPTPPSKHIKPSHPAVDPDREVQGTADEVKEKEEDSRKETTGTAVETEEEDHLISKEEEELLNVRGDQNPGTEVEVSKEESRDIISSPSPLEKSEKKPAKRVQPDIQETEDIPNISQPNEKQDHILSLQKASDTSDSSLQTEEALPKSEVPSGVVSLDDPHTDSLNLSPQLCQLPGEKKKKAEEKSVDSGQHSGNDSEGSGSEDTPAASTAAVRGSRASLDVSDTSEDNTQTSVSLMPTQASSEPQVRSEVLPCPYSKPPTPLKPSTKTKSASIGHLLSDSSVCIHLRQDTRAVAGSDRSPTDDVLKLETEVAMEMKMTGELLNRVSLAQGLGDREGTPEDLLAKAMEKLEKADHVLREVKKLELAKTSSNRMSW